MKTLRLSIYKIIAFLTLSLIPHLLESQIGSFNTETTTTNLKLNYQYEYLQHGNRSIPTQINDQCNYHTLWNLTKSLNKDNPKEKNAPQPGINNTFMTGYHSFYTKLKTTLTDKELTNGETSFIPATCLSWFIRKNNFENHVFIQPEVSIDTLLRRIDPKNQLEMLYTQIDDLQALNAQTIVDNIKFNFINGDWVYWIIDTKTDADKSARAGHVILIATKLIKRSTGKEANQQGEIKIEIFDSLMDNMLFNYDAKHKNFIYDYFIPFLEKFMDHYRLSELPKSLQEASQKTPAKNAKTSKTKDFEDEEVSFQQDLSGKKVHIPIAIEISSDDDEEDANDRKRKVKKQETTETPKRRK